MGILFGSERRSAPVSWPVPPIPAYLGADTAATGVGQEQRLRADPNRALIVPTVWACVSLLANTVSMMPLQTYRRTSGGTPGRIGDPQVVSAPSAGLSQSEWLHAVVVSLCLRGNTYGLIVARDTMGRPVQIELLSPDQVRVKLNPDTGRLEYRLGTDDRDRAADIWHVRGLVLPGTKVGLSPVAYGAAAMGVDVSARGFGAGFFEDGSHPSAILTSTQTVDSETATTIKMRFREAIRGREPAVLGAGVQYTPIQVAPNESQFLETMQANVSQIARFFGVPAEMVGGTSGDSMTYANVEQRSLDFLTFGVSVWLRRIEDAVSALLPSPQYVKFDTSVLLRTDAETQSKIDAIQVATKVKAPSEIRHGYELPPMTPDQLAEVAMVPLTVTPVGAVKPLPGAAEAVQASDDATAAEAARSAGRSVSQPGVSVPLTVNVALPAGEAPRVTVENRIDPTPVEVHVPPVEVTVEQVPGPTSTTVRRNQAGEIDGTDYHYDNEGGD